MPDAAAVFARETRSLVARLRLWTPQRWSAALPPFGSRADLVHHLAAGFVRAGGETDRPLPRLASDLGLPDQLAVTADDLLRVRPEAAPTACAHLLLHRWDLLAEQVPPGLAGALGLEDVLAAGRAACAR